jgi:DNA-binding winged helix-turn-helix (wHTH) protein/tetratricopeptide (TPR) repeat protein
MVRPQPTSEPVLVHFGAFELDEANASLRRQGQPVALAPTPFTLLCALARRPGTLLTKSALLDEVWGHQFVTDSVLKTAISDLRTVLDDDPRQPRYIETVSRRGYRFIAHPVAQAVAASPPAVAHEAQRDRPADAWFVGRADVLARLDALWAATRAGQRAVVWVAGEAGIGKTTLIERFLAGIGDVACGRGQCVDLYGAGEPYLPVLEALAELCRSDAELPALLRLIAPTWLLQLPWLSSVEEREALRHDLVGVGPERMLREMGQLLDRYTERRPLLLVTEDLHWSDRATIQLIDYLARRRGSARFMWLASFRLAEVVALDHPLSQLRRELRLHGLCEELVLDPFSETEVGEYVARRLPAMADDEAFIRTLHGRTDGVPLFVSSLLVDTMYVNDSARTSGPALESAAADALAVPENLAALIDHYITRLSDEQRALLSTAAVAGDQFRVGPLALALEREPAVVDQACDELARMQLWLRRTGSGADAAPPSYAFRHALFRQVLYERTGAAVRAQLHRRVGLALQVERAAGAAVTAAELAMHFERGHEPMQALRYYAEAAAAAVLNLSPGQCMSLTQAALELLPQANASRERDAVEFELNTLRGLAALHLFGPGSDAKDALQRAYALLPGMPKHPQRGLLLHNLGFVLCLRADYGEALAVADLARALAADGGDPLLQLAACTVQAEVHLLQGRPAAGRTLVEAVLPDLESIDVEPAHSFAQVTLLGLLAIHLFHLGLTQQAQARVQQAHARAAQLGQPMGVMVALWFDALLQVRLGDIERLSQLAVRMQTLVEETQLGQGRAAWRWFMGCAQAHRGDAQRGFRQIRDAFEQNTRAGMLAGGSEVLAYAAEALVLAGDHAGAERQLEQAFAIAGRQDERVYLPQLLLLQAAVARARGDAAAARAAGRRAIAEARAQEAGWLELEALVQVLEHGEADPHDRKALAGLVAGLTEAQDTALMARARALLAHPSRSRGSARRTDKPE